MALKRSIGGVEVMCAQLRQLIELTELPNVTLDVFPLREGHATVTGPFSILRFAEPELPDVVYAEQLTSAIYLDSREDLDRYRMEMERVCGRADRTVKILETILHDIS
jgi:hypothetical protein